MAGTQNSLMLLVLFTLVLAACAAGPITPIVSRPDKVERSFDDGLVDDYVVHVEQGRSALRAGQLDLAESNFQEAADTLLFERANYEIWIELAEVDCRLGKTAAARELMEHYSVALKVAYRQEHCLMDWGPEMTVSPNPRIPLMMYGVMCNAFVQTYSYADLTDDGVRAFKASYEAKRHELSILEKQCTAISE